MITFDTVLLAIELVLLIGFGLMVSRLDFTSDSRNPLGDALTTPILPHRPQGVQEEDLPRFVFRTPAPSLNPA